MMKCLLLFTLSGCVLLSSCGPSLRKCKAKANEPAQVGQSQIFWLDFFGRKVRRANSDGSRPCVLGRTHRAPDGIAIDQENGWVYVSNMGSIFGSGGGSIQRVRLDGSQRKREYIIAPNGPDLTTPKQLQFDKKSGKLYWGDREGKMLWRADAKVGAKPQPLLAPEQVKEGVGVALDVDRGHIYFSDRLGKAIHRIKIPRDGQSAATKDQFETLFETEDEKASPIDLALDLENRILYFTDRYRGEVRRIPMDPQRNGQARDLEPKQLLVENLKQPIGIDLDLENGEMFVTTLFRGQVFNLPIEEEVVDAKSRRPLKRSLGATGIVLLKN